jgi:hypothetical protein
MKKKQENLNGFELHIIKLATQDYIKRWQKEIIKDEKDGNKRGIFSPRYPELVYSELERKLNLQDV